MERWVSHMHCFPNVHNSQGKRIQSTCSTGGSGIQVPKSSSSHPNLRPCSLNGGWMSQCHFNHCSDPQHSSSDLKYALWPFITFWPSFALHNQSIFSPKCFLSFQLLPSISCLPTLLCKSIPSWLPRCWKLVSPFVRWLWTVNDRRNCPNLQDNKLFCPIFTNIEKRQEASWPETKGRSQCSCRK